MVNACDGLFFQDWSNLDVLLVKSRSTRLQDLQLLSEIREFIEFMINPGMLGIHFILCIHLKLCWFVLSKL